MVEYFRGVKLDYRTTTPAAPLLDGCFYEIRDSWAYEALGLGVSSW